MDSEEYRDYRMLDAFNTIRTLLGEPRHPELKTKKYDDELLQMKPSDGLKTVIQHPVESLPHPAVTPEVTEEMKQQIHLWIIRLKDCVYALERSEFGDKLENGKIKHTNLTGGEPAFTGGELIWITEREVIVNGCSGRYGPKNANEMTTAAKAFSNSGYRTWTTGYDEGTGYCFRFGASIPVEALPQ
ncbi:hypothetical protein [Malikia spinosa]|uniref:hypothetical protein n=1 Tax=Malikia spinosa TaxID=86180 RepID=UPI0011B03BDF|nr:hypothetical protein [Malikia spinosa]